MHHDEAHDVFDAYLDRIVGEATAGGEGTEERGWAAWCLTVRFRHELLGHLHHEEANLILHIAPERAPSTLIRDHEQLRDALGLLEHRALDQAYDLAHPSRLAMAVAEVEALLEHHDERERSLYEGLEGLDELPDVPPPPEREALLAPLEEPAVRGARLRYAAWIAGKPLPPLDTEDHAFARLVTRDDRLAKRDPSDEPRRALAERRRLELTLRSTIRYALLHG